MIALLLTTHGALSLTTELVYSTHSTYRQYRIMFDARLLSCTPLQRQTAVRGIGLQSNHRERCLSLCFRSSSLASRTLSSETVLLSDPLTASSTTIFSNVRRISCHHTKHDALAREDYFFLCADEEYRIKRNNVSIHKMVVDCLHLGHQDWG